jgi:ELWxxDGT repeat protein
MHLGSLYSGLNDGSAILKDKLYFSANNFENGEELYSTDGTPEGTALIKDMDKIYNGSYPKNFTTSGSAVYFTANEVYGNSVELWKTTGTTKTTKLVKHIVYSHYTTLENFTGAGSKLYFMNNDTLWVSDGTDQGTQTVSDAGLDDVNDISYIFGVGNKLFLSCSSYKYGYELYEGDAKLIGNSFANNTIAKKINSPINSLTAQVVSNPFLNDLKIIFNTAKTQRLNISIYNSVGQQMSYKATSVIEGNTLITFNTAGWSLGVYMIHIYSDAGTTILKAVH